MPGDDFRSFEEQARRTRATLEETHERLLALLGYPQLLHYGDVRDLIRRVDWSSPLEPDTLDPRMSVWESKNVGDDEDGGGSRRSSNGTQSS